MTAFDFKVGKRKGGELDLADLRGKVLLIVNTATGCGFTPQYKALEALYEAYHEAGLEILDFPCNQFGNQAPDDDETIHEFCTARYKTQFDQLAKIDVNGENASALFVWLKAQGAEEINSGVKGKLTMKAIDAISTSAKERGDIRWNFTKFLIDRDGNVAARYAPTVDPSDIEKEIVRLLG